MFANGKRLLELVGVEMLLVIAQLAFCTRVYTYTLVSAPEYILIVEPLHGITYGTCSTAILTHKIVPPGCWQTATVEHMRQVV